MNMAKITRIEITFPVPVRLPKYFTSILLTLVDTVCKDYEHTHPDRVMWAAGHGNKMICKNQKNLFLMILY